MKGTCNFDRQVKELATFFGENLAENPSRWHAVAIFVFSILVTLRVGRSEAFSPGLPAY